MTNYLYNIARRVGIDRAIAWVIIGRSWALAGGPVTIFLIGTRLSPEEQGYYYTFANLLSMAMFFELGLGGWITRFASYEMAKLHWTNTGSLAGNALAHQRLSSLLRFGVHWFAGAALLFFAVVFPVGCYFFQSQPGSEAIAWLLPWLLVVLATASSLLLSPFFSFLEGCGLVAQMARLQFFRTLAGNIVFWGSLLMGLRLLSSPILNAVGILWGMAYLIAKRHILTELWHKAAHKTMRLDWKHELLPLQWRTAVTMIAGYLSWQTANPILFKLAGPEEAGKLGMSLSLVIMLQSFGMAWINTKVPRMGGLLAQGDREGMSRLFRTSFIQTMAVAFFGGITLLIATIVLNALHNPLAHRLLTSMQMGVLLLNTLIGTAQIAFVVYVRIHKQEPFVIQMVAMGVLMPIVCYLAGLLQGTTGMLIGMVLANFFFGLLWTLFIVHTLQKNLTSQTV